MDRKTGWESSHKDYFRFQMKISEILSEYDIDELESFYQTSRNVFPHMASLLQELIFLASKGLESGELRPHDSRAKKTQATTVDSHFAERQSKHVATIRAERIDYAPILRSRSVFPTNKDLADFSMKVLRLRLGWKWDSRDNMVRKMQNHMDRLRGSERAGVLRSLRNLATHKGYLDENPLDDSFFSSWEKIIREKGRQNE